MPATVSDGDKRYDGPAIDSHDHLGPATMVLGALNPHTQGPDVSGQADTPGQAGVSPSHFDGVATAGSYIPDIARTDWPSHLFSLDSAHKRDDRGVSGGDLHESAEENDDDGRQVGC